MIRRPHNNALLLITQHDHARLSGDLAAHYAAGPFPPPDPLQPTLTAIRMHDSGWPLHDGHPTLNPHGLPLHVFETPPEISIPVWTASADRAAAEYPYAGLLVSLHTMALSLLSAAHYGINPSSPKDDPTIPEPRLNESRRPPPPAPSSSPDKLTLRRHFDLNRFQHQEVERQHALRQQLNLPTHIPLRHGLAPPGLHPEEDRLTTNFRLLQLMDRLSLAALCHEPLFNTLTLIPAPNADPIQVRLHKPHPTHLQLDPWIFNTPEMTFTVNGGLIPQGPYPDNAALHSAYGRAPVEPLQIQFCPLEKG